MAIEIERKFLVRTNAWQGHVVRSSHITDGVLLSSGDRKLRVRIRDGAATLAFKGAREGLARDEFEYAIPLADALHMLKQQCDTHVLTKTRHEVPYKGFMWEVDVYDFPLEGVILAEVELTGEAVEVPLPDWVGDEVSGQPRYRKQNMLAARLAHLNKITA